MTQAAPWESGSPGRRGIERENKKGGILNICFLGRLCVVNAGNFGCDMFGTNHNTARVPRYQHEGEISFELNHIFCCDFHFAAGECLSSHELRNRTRADILEQRS